MKITKNLKDRCWRDTNKCYCKALKETYPELLKDFDEKQFKQFGIDREMREVLIDADQPTRSPDIHRLYMKHVLNLSTKKLELIIECDKQGAIPRAPYTIDEIVYELLDRAVKESQPKEEHDSKETVPIRDSVEPSLRSDEP